MARRLQIDASKIRRCSGCIQIAALALLTQVACTGAPVPHEALAAADLALTRAETAGAAHHAPVELAQAEAKLQAARAALRTKAHERARILAEQAMVDAELAEVRAQAAQAEAAAERLRQRSISDTAGWRRAGMMHDGAREHHAR